MSEYRKITRSRDRVIGGVCGGIAKFFNIDPVLVRIVLLLAFLCGGIGLLAYIVCWILVPEES